MKKRKIIYRFIKRTFDIFCSLILLIILALPMFIIALCIVCDSKGGVLFKQKRIGKNGKVFNIYKFRSMYTNAEKDGVYSDDNDTRITKVGSFIRKTSLDELPQLLNIFKGEMSFVGPRPVLTYHPWTYDKYTEHQLIMFETRPGITGWAQVNGRKTVEWHKRIEMNVWYIEHQSLWLDIKILFKTIGKVLKNNDNENHGASLNDKHLKLMYITNNPEIAKIIEDNGVDCVFIDMEYIGKDIRQNGLDSVKNHHTIEDIYNVRKVISKAELLVRINPIHDGSEEEINQTIASGADTIMLPMFKTVQEVDYFIKQVNKRCKTCLLVETKEAVEVIDDILALPGIDEIHIGLNDLHLSYGMRFMFELINDGTVEKLCNKFKEKGITYGFGGVSKLGGGDVPAEYIIAEHYRLGSSMAILSRSFCNCSKVTDLSEIETIFKSEMQKIRDYEEFLKSQNDEYFKNSNKVLKEKIEAVAERVATHG